MNTTVPTRKIIDVKVNDREQLFSTFNYTDDNLNPEFAELLHTKADQLPTRGKQAQFLIKIHTSSNHFQAAEVAQCVHHHFHNAYDTAKRELRRLNYLAILMLLFGLITLVFTDLAMRFADIFYLTEILDITAWVFVWEAVDIWFLRCPDARREATLLRALAFAEVSIAPDDHPLVTTYIK